MYSKNVIQSWITQGEIIWRGFLELFLVALLNVIGSLLTHTLITHASSSCF